MLRSCQSLTISTSKSLSRHARCRFCQQSLRACQFFYVVQTLATQKCSDALSLSVFNDFDFQIVLAPQRGVNFVDILGSRSSAPPRFSEPTLQAVEAMENIAFRAIPTYPSLLSRICCKISLPSNIDAARPACNFRYSRKLELLNLDFL